MASRESYRATSLWWMILFARTPGVNWYTRTRLTMKWTRRFFHSKQTRQVVGACKSLLGYTDCSCRQFALPHVLFVNGVLAVLTRAGRALAGMATRPAKEATGVMDSADTTVMAKATLARQVLFEQRARRKLTQCLELPPLALTLSLSHVLPSTNPGDFSFSCASARIHAAVQSAPAASPYRLDLDAQPIQPSVDGPSDRWAEPLGLPSTSRYG